MREDSPVSGKFYVSGDRHVCWQGGNGEGRDAKVEPLTASSSPWCLCARGSLMKYRDTEQTSVYIQKVHRRAGQYKTIKRDIYAPGSTWWRAVESWSNESRRMEKKKKKREEEEEDTESS